MTTLLRTYIDALYAEIETIPDFPARIERSTLRAFRREEYPVVVIHRGAEVISDDSPWPIVTRHRHLLVSVHGAGEDAEEDVETVFEILQPVLSRFAAAGLVQIEEAGTDEPKYAQGDLTRMVVTRRWRLTYQTQQDSLSG